jgi:competence protein ComEA
VKPGVYKLSQDARMQDAFISCGGLSSSADRNWVAKNINLAVKLTDGAKIYIPKLGEQTSSSSSYSSGVALTSSLININSASEQELDSLSGVGPATATKIINSRPYGSINDLLDKKIVGSKVFQTIKDKISVY